MIVQEKAVDWPGISVEVQPIHDYPTGELTAALVGFLGPIPANQESFYFGTWDSRANRDKVGYAGLELQYQDLLSGRNGRRVAEIDVGGQVLRPDIVSPQESNPGYSLRLTIDTRLQQAAEAVLFKDELDDWNKYFGKIVYSSGVVIAMSPQTGEILSMVTYPSYEITGWHAFHPGLLLRPAAERSDQSAAQPRGWRCPAGRVSLQTGHRHWRFE